MDYLMAEGWALWKMSIGLKCCLSCLAICSSVVTVRWLYILLIVNRFISAHSNKIIAVQCDFWNNPNVCSRKIQQLFQFDCVNKQPHSLLLNQSQCAKVFFVFPAAIGYQPLVKLGVRWRTLLELGSKQKVVSLAVTCAFGHGKFEFFPSNNNNYFNIITIIKDRNGSQHLEIAQ